MGTGNEAYKMPTKIPQRKRARQNVTRVDFEEMHSRKIHMILLDFQVSGEPAAVLPDNLLCLSLCLK